MSNRAWHIRFPLPSFSSGDARSAWLRGSAEPVQSTPIELCHVFIPSVSGVVDVLLRLVCICMRIWCVPDTESAIVCFRYIFQY
jgi:hypothetical protein